MSLSSSSSTSPSSHHTNTLLSIIKHHHLTDLGLIFQEPNLIQHASVGTTARDNDNEEAPHDPNQEDAANQQHKRDPIVDGVLGIGLYVFLEVLIDLKQCFGSEVFLNETLASSASSSSSSSNNILKLPLHDSFWLSRLWLLLYGDDYHLWNWRRRFFLRATALRNIQSPFTRSTTNDSVTHDTSSSEPFSFSQTQTLIDSELDFIDLVLSKHVKSEEAWSYRRWLLECISYTNQCLVNNNTSDTSDLELFSYDYQKELKVSQQGFARYYRNYYAYNFRFLVLELELKQRCLQQVSANNSSIASPDILFQELSHMFDFLKRNISDHTAVAHILRVLSLYHEKREELHRGLDQQQIASMEETYLIHFFKFYFLNQFLVTFYPGHETLWLQRRSLLSFLFDRILCHCGGSVADDDPSSSSASIPSIQKCFHEARSEIEKTFQIDSLYEYVQSCSLQAEILFVEAVQRDTQIDQYEKQIEHSLSFIIWICGRFLSCLQKKRSTLNIQQERFLVESNASDVESSPQHVNPELLKRCEDRLHTHLSNFLSQIQALFQRSSIRIENLPEEARPVARRMLKHHLSVYKRLEKRHLKR